MRRRSSLAAVTIRAREVSTSGEPAAQLHAQAGDLDRQTAGRDNPPQQCHPVFAGRRVQDARDGPPVALDRDPRAPVVSRGREPTRIDIGARLGIREEQLDPRVFAHLAQHVHDRLGLRPAGAEIVEEAGDAPQSGVAGAVEAAVEPVLRPRAQRPERHRDQQRRGRGRPRGAAAERGPEQEVRAGERRGEHHRDRRVHHRAVDGHVDVEEAVAQDRHARRERHEGEAHTEGRHPRLQVPGRPHEPGDHQEHGGQGGDRADGEHELELLPFEVPGPAQADDQRRRARRDAGQDEQPAGDIDGTEDGARAEPERVRDASTCAALARPVSRKIQPIVLGAPLATYG
jgi:hypothetical protein